VKVIDMKTIHDLMLKDTNHEEILHDGVVESPVDAIGFLNALDFVVKEWNEAMDSFDIDGQEDVAMTIYGDLMNTRLLFVDLMESGGPAIAFTEAVKTLNHLKQSMLSMAKSYARTPSLAHWYLSLPVKVQNYYNIMRRDARGNSQSS
tara:strand:+ start:206 stop:649 length:444 start_codon:yes stop_codon:yes gene_type:complete